MHVKDKILIKYLYKRVLKLGEIPKVEIWQHIIGCIGQHLWWNTNNFAERFTRKLGLYYNIFMDVKLRTQVIIGLMAIVELIPGGDDINNYISTSLFGHLLYTSPSFIARQLWILRVHKKEFILTLSNAIIMFIEKGIRLPRGDRCVILGAELLGSTNDDIVNAGVHVLKTYLSNISYFQQQYWLRRGLVQSFAEWTDHDTAGAFDKLLHFVIFEM